MTTFRKVAIQGRVTEAAPTPVSHEVVLAQVDAGGPWLAHVSMLAKALGLGEGGLRSRSVIKASRTQLSMSARNGYPAGWPYSGTVGSFAPLDVLLAILVREKPSAQVIVALQNCAAGVTPTEASEGAKTGTEACKSPETDLTETVPLEHIAKTAGVDLNEMMDHLSFTANTANDITRKGVVFATHFTPLGITVSRKTVPAFVAHYPWPSAANMAALAKLVEDCSREATQPKAEVPPAAEPAVRPEVAPVLRHYDAKEFMAQVRRVASEKAEAPPAAAEPAAKAEAPVSVNAGPEQASTASQKMAEESEKLFGSSKVEVSIPPAAQDEIKEVQAEVVGDDDLFGPEITEAKIEEVPRTKFGALTLHGVSTAVLELNGYQWVSVSGICQLLGLALDNQIMRLKEDPRFTTHDIMTRDTRGRSVSKFCLRADKVAGWLYAINPNKVGAEVRDKLLAYQDEISQAIDDYCRKGVAVNPRVVEPAAPSGQEQDVVRRMMSAVDAMEAMVRGNLQLKSDFAVALENQHELDMQRRELAATVELQKPKVQMAEALTGTGQTMTTTFASKLVGLQMSAMAVHALLRDEGVLCGEHHYDSHNNRYTVWRPSAGYDDPNFMKLEELIAYHAPEPVFRFQLVWTPQGAAWLGDFVRKVLERRASAPPPMCPKVPGQRRAAQVGT